MIFDLPENILDLMTDFISDLVGGSALLITLGIGVPLAFYVIKNILELFGFDEDQDLDEEKELSDGEISGFFSRLRRERGRS